MSAATHYKGFDQFGSVTFHLGAEPLVKALEDSDYDLHYMPAHEAATAFPMTMAELDAYDAVLLSDLGSNTLLLHPDVWLQRQARAQPPQAPARLGRRRRRPDDDRRLLLASRASTVPRAGTRRRSSRCCRSPACRSTIGSRCPTGFARRAGRARASGAPGLGGRWPLLLGVNEVAAQGPRASCWPSCPDEEGGHPLLVAGTHGKGRTLAWTSDIGPHWVPDAFVAWDGYARLWRQALDWLTAARA